jgi:hypothetical protein
MNRRTLLPPVLPADFAEAHPDLARLIEELARHRADAGKVHQERMALETRIPVARQQDVAALTAAVRAGKPDPGSPNVAAVQQPISPLSVRERGLRLALAATEGDLLALHAAHGAEWAVEAHERALRARATAREAIEAALRAAEAVQTADQLTAWCLGGKVLPLGVPATGSRMRGHSMSLVDAFAGISRAFDGDQAAIEESVEEEAVA